jgi:hypothetical protein
MDFLAISKSSSYFLAALGFELGLTLLGRYSYFLSYSTNPFFVIGVFEIGSGRLFAQGWLQTMILLISAS